MIQNVPIDTFSVVKPLVLSDQPIAPRNRPLQPRLLLLQLPIHLRKCFLLILVDVNDGVVLGG